MGGAIPVRGSSTQSARERFRLSNFLSANFQPLENTKGAFLVARRDEARKVDVINNNYSPGVDRVDGVTGRR